MRKIKFRAWDRNENKFIYFGIISGIRANVDYKYRIDYLEEPEQFTGLHDKNGKEIYEGDRVRILYTDWPSQTDFSISSEDYLKSISLIGNVVWQGVGWLLEFPGKYGSCYDSIIPGKHGRIEVIGNIHEGIKV